MARLVMLCLIVLGACWSLHSTLAGSTPPIQFYNTPESNYRHLESSGDGDFILEEIVAEGILISRFASTMHVIQSLEDSSETSIWSESSLLPTNPEASAAFSKLLLIPSDDEIHEALKVLVWEYMEYRRKVTPLDNDEALLVKEVEARMGTLPPTPVTATPNPKARFVVSSVPPELNPEGLEGLVTIAQEVKLSAEEERFLSKLKGKMFINSITKKYSLIAEEFLNSE